MNKNSHPLPTRSGLLRQRFQQNIGGKQSDLFILENKRGTEICVTNYGARIVSWLTPDRGGAFDDIVLGFDSIQGYLDSKEIYFGATIGRFANRITNSRFTLDGVEYSTHSNEGPNTLHGGSGGFHSFVWDCIQRDARTLEFSHVSPDGDQGFPGTLRVKMIYSLTDDGELRLITEAVTDKPTVVNFTNHSFFNLNGAGSGSIDDYLLTIHASRYTPIGERYIPTGEIAPVAGTQFDFRNPVPIGDRRGLNFALDCANPVDGLHLAARAVSPKSGRVFEVITNQPGLQLYCGHLLDGSIKGKAGKPYIYRSAFCLEPQHFPDSPNRPNFPSTVLRPGETRRHVCIYKCSVEK